jgi:hypothetical protein
LTTSAAISTRCIQGIRNERRPSALTVHGFVAQL